MTKVAQCPACGSRSFWHHFPVWEVTQIIEWIEGRDIEYGTWSTENRNEDSKIYYECDCGHKFDDPIWMEE